MGRPIKEWQGLFAIYKQVCYSVLELTCNILTNSQWTSQQILQHMEEPAKG